jgi:iron complex outermembrane receptor protein
MFHTIFIFYIFFIVCWLPKNAHAQHLEDISLDSLLNIQITTASKYWQTTSDAPASVTIITSKEIERYGYRTLDEVLASVRGFYTSYDRNYSYIGVRGFSRPTDYNNRLLLLLNGHSMNETVYGAASGGTDFVLPLSAIDHIEIVRGPGSSLYGTSAMFAVVNIITNNGAMFDGMLFRGELGSFGMKKASFHLGNEFDFGLNLSLSGTVGDVDGQDLYFAEFDSDSTNSGVANNLDWDKFFGVFSNVEYKSFTLLGFYSKREKGIPTASYFTIFNNPNSHTFDSRSFLDAQYKYFVSDDKTISARGYYDMYAYNGQFAYEPDDNFEFTDGKWWGGELQFRWDVVANNRIVVGSEWKKTESADFRYRMGSLYFSRNTPFSVFSAFLQDEFQFSKNLFVTVGIRRDNYSTVGSSTNPRGAIVYHPLKNSTIKFLYGEAFRAPNPYEMMYEDSSTQHIRSRNLQPEKIRTEELVLEHRFSDEVFVVASLYEYRVNDLIDTKMNDDSSTQFQNVDETEALGLELETNIRLKNGLRSYFNYATQHTDDENTHQRLSNSPQHIFKSGISYTFPYHIIGAVECYYETERITVFETTTRPYALTNFHCSTVQFADHLKLALLVRNVFDVRYANPGGYEHTQPSILQDGRNFTFIVEYKF